MTKFLLPCLSLLTVFAACGADKPAPAQPAAAPAPGGGDDHHGERHELGQVTLAGHTLHVVQQGEVTAGGEALVFVAFDGDAPLPTTRAWIGVQSGAGSMKARLTKEDPRTLHAHLEVPQTLPEGAALWIEVEDGAARLQNSFAFHR